MVDFFEYFLELSEDVLLPIAVVVGLPSLIFWIIYRWSTHKTRSKEKIILKALENNANLDPKEIVAVLRDGQINDRQRLNLRLLRGCIFTLCGLVLAIMALLDSYSSDMLIASGILVAIGASYLIVWQVSRKDIEKTLKEESVATIENSDDQE